MAVLGATASIKGTLHRNPYRDSFLGSKDFARWPLEAPPVVWTLAIFHQVHRRIGEREEGKGRGEKKGRRVEVDGGGEQRGDGIVGRQGEDREGVEGWRGCIGERRAGKLRWPRGM